jgi:acetyl-CoA synthetase
MSPASARLRTARDLLVRLRTSYDEAVSSFTWPDVGPTFNFGHDWFDAFARGNDRPALVLVEENGDRSAYTFDELARRSDQVGAHLLGSGIGPGDSVIVMLGNQVELWESMLAIIKIGAVVMPTTTAVGPAELADRVERGQAKAVICNAADTVKFDEVPGHYLRVAVGVPEATPEGWQDYAAAYRLP